MLTPDKANVINTSPDDSDPLKFVDVNCTSKTKVVIIVRNKSFKYFEFNYMHVKGVVMKPHNILCNMK